MYGDCYDFGMDEWIGNVCECICGVFDVLIVFFLFVIVVVIVWCGFEVLKWGGEMLIVFS